MSLRLPAGGRYDLVFVMPDTSVALVLDGDRETELWLHPDDAEREPATEDTSDWPELDLLRYGTPARHPFDPDTADRDFTLVLDRAVAMVDGRPSYAQSVNGRGHPSIPDMLVAEGDIVLRFRADLRPGLLVPARHGLGVLLDGPLVRALEGQTSPLEVLAHARLGQLHPVQLHDQLAHQPTRPPPAAEGPPAPTATNAALPHQIAGAPHRPCR